MWYLLAFFLGGIAAIFVSWLWEHLSSQGYGPLVRALDEYKAAAENERLLGQLVEEDLPHLNRREIWTHMGWIWKETRGWVLKSASLAGFAGLGLLVVIYCAIWLKTLLFPNSYDLRYLLGARGFLLHIVHSRS